jgi:hypothetical protein
MVIDKNSQIIADGTEDSPIIFTSTKVRDDAEPANVGQWGGLTLIGNAGNTQVAAYEVNSDFSADQSDQNDSSGVLRHVKILNSGITMEQDKEINGLSFVGVGNGTVVENITIENSDDDGIELWGGTVNMENITITKCTDDYFDIDDGYSGTVKNLTIDVTTGNAAIEMSGTTAATFDGFTITNNSTTPKEGSIYFKKDGIGGHFKNGTITHYGTGTGAIYSKSSDASSDNVDIANTTFADMTIKANEDAQFTGTSATTLKTKYEAATSNSLQTVPASTTLVGSIRSDLTLTADQTWTLDGMVVVTNGATLTIEPGTTIVGKDGTGSATSYLLIDKGAKINADGTSDKPITFTSKTANDGGAAAVGQWGGLTIVGKATNAQVDPYEVNSAYGGHDASNVDLADNSGVLRHVKILNSGITMEQDKEINGLSLVGVGSGTTIENITVEKSDDDCVELWGGTVNLSDITVSECTDDHFDIDDGYNGTVTRLTITQTTGNAAIEMSGDTRTTGSATFNSVDITQNTSAKEGVVYFKKDNIGAKFVGGTIRDNVDDGNGAIYSKSGDGSSDTVDATNTSFTNVTIESSDGDDGVTGTSDATLTGKITGGTGNTLN